MKRDTALLNKHDQQHGHDHDHDHSHQEVEQEGCGCGHAHDHAEVEPESCGCGHDHAHEDAAASCINHPGDCQCEVCHPHAQYCDVCGESLSGCTCAMPDDHCEKRVYLVENLGCANCAAKMETKIRALEGVEYATLTYTTKQLRLSAVNHQELLPTIQKICADIEPGVQVVPRTKSPGAVVTKTYHVENLSCANCAAKMERQITALPGISACTVTYATSQMRLTAKDPDSYLAQVRDICTAIEPEVEIREKDRTPASASGGQKEEKGEKSALAVILTGAALFIVGEVLERILPVAAPWMFVVAYLVLGWPILREAGRNLLKGQVFDENFLMSVATLGAFAIQQFPEAVGVMLFYRVGEAFEEWAVAKSRNQIMSAVDLRPEVVNLVVGEEVRIIPSEDAQVGDILLVRPGDRIPLDGVVIDGESRIDTSPVTGEPVPVKAAYGSEVLSGCVNTTGALKIRVEKVLEESMVTRILDSVENAAAQKPKMDKFITRFARIYTPFVLGFALLVAVVPSLITGNWQYWIYTALTFLVISCPCALVLSVPLAFFSGIGAGSRKGILFKGGVTLEFLDKIKAVVMDKTGTVTKGDFSVQTVETAGELDGDQLLAMVAGSELSSTHPIAASIVSAAQAKGLDIVRPTSVQEVAGQGIVAETALGEVLCGNRELLENRGVALPQLSTTDSGTQVLAARGGVYQGRLLISDTIKEEAKGAIATLRQLGIHTAMLTGDNQQRAQVVADAVGIDRVHGQLLPEDKVSQLLRIREEKGAVLFVGDGINDAPVLAAADVGAAMGSGADAAIEVADVVYMTSSLQAIPDSLAIAKATNRIAMQNVVFALAIKVVVMALGLAGYASMWMAVFADTGVSLLCVLNSIRILYKK